MSSQDFSADFHLSDSGSRLMSESLLSASSSRTGHGGDDLSLSELSIGDLPTQAPPRRKFSLFAQPTSPSVADESALADEDEEEQGQEYEEGEGEADEGGLEEGGFDETMRAEDIEKAQRVAAKSREEKLQSDLYILKKLNAAFDLYNEALRETKSSTDRVAVQLENTNALLDKYVDILSTSEKVTKLILDERWEGAETDENQIALEEAERTRKAELEEQERQLAAERERERLERIELDRKAREEQELLAREKQEKSKVRGSGVRGVRGTRASMRGMRGASASTRGAAAAASAATRGTGPGTSTGIPTRRPGGSASVGGIPRSSTVRK
ncbi:hypothetical protein BDW22DRAFT_244883 [Trametopsis cervina]|nr:hypothetical protein BDW22DRAFT_244883 [Trametopsis cervina]